MQTAQSPEISLRTAWKQFLKKVDCEQSRSSCAEKLWLSTKRRTKVLPNLVGLNRDKFVQNCSSFADLQ
jgi:hypothetical protein